MISFLTGLPERDSKPEQIGPYRIVQEIEPIEGARCFYARDGATRGHPALLSDVRAADGISEAIVERERVALDRLEERDRTWQIHPSFEYEPRQWIVVPVIPARGKSLVTSVRMEDPKREDGRLPRKVMINVVTDAFRGLAEVHEVGLSTVVCIPVGSTWARPPGEVRGLLPCPGIRRADHRAGHIHRRGSRAFPTARRGP